MHLIRLSAVTPCTENGSNLQCGLDRLSTVSIEYGYCTRTVSAMVGAALLLPSVYTAGQAENVTRSGLRLRLTQLTRRAKAHITTCEKARKTLSSLNFRGPVTDYFLIWSIAPFP